ncbi:hypothetical protein GCM10010401_08690 [Rarobacter faecitabidus]|uniref:Uncharacterized protein n=1 Tax=Rarobacter faecitabidus TaxID=13243 RepID=A0A542ZB40_RARFA|nr:hypothetical protein FB461_2207 [Rarobacter faecitabidus]
MRYQLKTLTLVLWAIAIVGTIIATINSFVVSQNFGAANDSLSQITALQRSLMWSCVSLGIALAYPIGRVLTRAPASTPHQVPATSD